MVLANKDIVRLGKDLTVLMKIRDEINKEILRKQRMFYRKDEE